MIGLSKSAQRETVTFCKNNKDFRLVVVLYEQLATLDVNSASPAKKVFSYITQLKKKVNPSQT